MTKRATLWFFPSTFGGEYVDIDLCPGYFHRHGRIVKYGSMITVEVDGFYFTCPVTLREPIPGGYRMRTTLDWATVHTSTA